MADNLIRKLERGNKMYQELGISNKVEELAQNTENELKEEFSRIDRICEINSLKVDKNTAIITNNALSKE